MHDEVHRRRWRSAFIARLIFGTVLKKRARSKETMTRGVV